MGNVESAIYDSAGRVTEATLKDGAKIYVSPVQTQGLPDSSSIDPLNPARAKALGAVNSTYVDSRGFSSSTSLDRAGQMSGGQDGQGNLAGVTRNGFNLVTSTQSPRGNRTQLRYDEQGNVIQASDSLSPNGTSLYEGTIDFARQVNYHSLSITSTTLVNFDRVSQGVDLDLLHGDSQLIWNGGSDGSVFLYPGEYKLRATRTTPGTYSFRFQSLAEATEIAAGTSQQISFNNLGESIAYRINANAFDRIAFTPLANSNVIQWKLIGPQATNSFFATANAVQSPTLPATGTYTLVLWRIDGLSTQLNFGFRIENLGNFPLAPATGQVINLGQSVTSSIDTVSEIDRYKFTIATSKRVYLDRQTNGSFTYALSGPVSNTSLDESDGPEILLPGEYQLSVSSTATGTYRFSLVDLAAAQTVVPGTNVDGTLNPSNSTLAYRFTANEGERYYLDVVTNQSIGGGGTRLIDPTGGIAWSINSLSDQEFTTNWKGEYLLLVEGALNELPDVDTFRIRLLKPVDRSQSLVFGQLTTGNFATIGDSQQYTFSLNAATLLYFDDIGVNTLYPTLWGPNGQVTSGWSNGSVALAPGDYRLVFDPFGASLGDFSFKVSKLSDAPVLNIGIPTSGILNPFNSTNLYRFNASAGDRFYFDVLEDNDISNGSWSLLDAEGTRVYLQSFSDRLTVTMPRTGQFYLLIEGANNEQSNAADSYRFILESRGTETAPTVTGIPKAFGALVTGELTSAAEKHHYKFNLPNDSSVFLDSHSYTNSFQWTISSATKQIGSSSFTQDSAIIDLPSGDYQVSVESNGSVGTYEFRFFNLASVTPLTLGTPVSSTLNPSNEVDVYQFSANAGDRYFFDVLEDRDISLGGWRLIAPDGSQVWSQAFGDRATEPMTFSGVYTLIVEGRNDEGGDPDIYRFQVEPQGTTLTPQLSGVAKTFGSLVTGELTSANEKHYYKFTLPTDGSLFIDSESYTGAFDWNLTSATGLITSGSFFSDSNLVSLKAGDYQVSVESNGPVGVYAFRLHSLNAAAVVTPGTPVSGSLNPSNQSDVYRFNASAGDYYFFDILEDRDISLGSWRLIRPDGVEAWTQSFADRQPELITMTGQYSLIVDGRNDEGGDPDVYRINVEPRGTITNPAVLGTATALGALVTGELTSASEKLYYKYTLASESQVYFDSHSYTGSYDWSISSADRLIESSSFFSDSSIKTLPAGEYQISVESNGTTGPFEFRFSSLSNATPLTPGIPVSGALDPSNESDLYRFNATAGDIVKFDILEDRNISLGSWRLIAPSGEQVWSQTFFSRDAEVLEKTGQYTLMIDGRIDEEGSPDIYRINVEPRGTVANPQVTGTDIAFGSTVTGQINNANEKFYYKFSVPSSGSYLLDSLTPVINFTWEINTATQSLGSSVVYNDSSVLRLEAGDYQIAVTSFGATGAFAFRMLSLADGTVFTPGNTISGAINPVLEAETYRFSADIGDRFSFDAITFPTNSTYWQLISPSGRTLWNQSYSDRSTETLLETGAYSLVLYGDLNSLGNYSFQVVPQGNQPPVGFTGDFIVPGQLVTGQLTATTNQISYRLNVAAESFVFLDGKEGTSFRATINDSYGFVAQASPLTGNAGPIKLRPGTYQILVEGFGSVGPFYFRLLDNPTATPIVLGELTTATLDRFDSVAYRFTANAGDRIAYNFHSADTNFSTNTLQLVDPLGNVIRSSGFLSDVEPVPLFQSGAYTLLLSSTSLNEGLGKIQFTLENRGPFAAPIFAGVPLTLGQVQSGAFTDTVRGLLYKFTLPTASTIYVDTYSDSALAIWSIYDSIGKVASNYIDSNYIKLEAGDYQIGFENNSTVNGSFDFNVIDFSTATSIVPNLQTTVTLGIRETKVYQFNATAGDQFDLRKLNYENFSNGSKYYQIIGPDGELVATKQFFGDSSPLAPLNRSGRYYAVFVRNETIGWPANLSFVLESRGTAALPTVFGSLISTGQAQQGELTESVRGLYYKFTLSTATNIMVDILSASNIGWTLTGQNGYVTASNGGDSGIIRVAAGDYQLLLNSLSSPLGTFSFQVLDLGSSAAVTLGDVTTATLGVRESKAYRFNANAGDQLALDIIATENFSNGSNNYQLIDPYGESVFSGQIASGTAPVTLKHSGNYSLLLTRNDPSGVAARVVFNLQPRGTLQTPSVIGTQISTGQVIQGELTDTVKAIYYKFTLASDTKILVDTLTGNSNIRWTLNGPKGSLTSSVSDSNIQLLSAGNYQIAYQAFNNQYGPFSFQLLDLATTTAIVPNTTTSVNLALRESKAYRFDATVGDRISLSQFTISNFSNGSNSLQLLDPQGESVWSNTIGTNIPPMTLNRTGVYNLVVSRNDSSGVSARLVFGFEKLGTLIARQFPGTSIAIGQVQQGELTTSAPAVYYKFTVPAATAVVVDKQTDSSNVRWVLGNAQGAITSSTLDSGAINLIAGEYSLVFSASNLTADTSYTFKILSATLAEAVSTNTTVTSQFGLKETKLFRFAATAGERYVFDIVNSAGINTSAAVWTLADPNGETLWNAQLVDQAPIVLNSSGNYSLRISRNDSTGSAEPISFKVESAPSSQVGTLGLDGSGGKRMTYDGSFNMLTRMVDERGMVTSINVNPSNGNTQSVTIAEGTSIAATSTLAYDARGQVTSMTDALGRVTEMEYNALGRVVRQTQAKGTTLEQTDRFEYDAVGNLTAFVDALGRRTETTYDSMGRPLSVKDPLGRVTQFRYDTRGNLLSATDPLGRTTTSTFDARDRIVKTLFVDGNDVEYRYDSAGNLVSATDERGNTTRTNFDSRGRPESILQANGTVYSTVYDADNNPSQMFDALGRATRFEYDLRGQNTRLINALGQETTKTFDANGNVLSIVDRGVRTTFEYDIRNRMTARLDADPDGAGPLISPRTQYVYDAIGNLTQMIDPLGRVTRMEYDALNRVIRTIDPRNAETRYEYDAVGNTTAVIDSVGNRTSFRFDALNRVIEETDPTGAKKLFEYDAVGNLVKRTDRNSRVTTFDYDNRNRLLHETWVGGVNVIEYSYEPDGTLSFIADDASALDFTFDSLNRIDTVEDSLGARFQYTYDANGNTTSVRQDISSFITSSPISTNTVYSYDALDRMQSVVQTGTGISSKRAEFAYTNNGMLASISRFSAATGGTALSRSEWTYDGLRRLDAIAHKNGAGTPISSFDFDFDIASQLTKQTNSRGVVDYGYDAASQVTSATYSDAAFADETYAFDANGNRTSTHVAATGHQTGTANRMQSDGKYNYVYDAEGNLIRRTTIVGGTIREFTWDYRNRLTAVIEKNAAGVATKSSRYTYDAMNRRITESVDETPNDTVDAAIVHFVYDREDIVTELIDADGKGPQKPTVRTQYMHGPGIDQVLARETSGATEWLLTDHLGSTVLIVNSSGAQVASANYDSFGNIIASTGTIGRFGYTGRELDTSTGLYYYRARYYDPAMGRFVSEDPIGFGGGDANLQRYVGNVPIGFVDPMGLESGSIALLSSPGHDDFKSWYYSQSRSPIKPGSWQYDHPHETYLGLAKNGVTRELVAQELMRNPNKYFPFDVVGDNGITRGALLQLRGPILAGHLGAEVDDFFSRIVDTTLNLVGLGNGCPYDPTGAYYTTGWGVKVVDVSSTGFTFETLDDTDPILGPGPRARIHFEVVQRGDKLFLTQFGKGHYGHGIDNVDPLARLGMTPISETLTMSAWDAQGRNMRNFVAGYSLQKMDWDNHR